MTDPRAPSTTDDELVGNEADRDEFVDDEQDTEQEPDSFQRLYKEVQDGRLSTDQAVKDVLAILAGEPVERHFQEDDPEGYEQYKSDQEQAKSPQA